MTTKQRAYLKSLAMTMEPVFQLGKGGLTPEFTKAVDEALSARELIKINVLKNCADEPKELVGGMQELYDVMSGSSSQSGTADQYFDDMMSVYFSPIY